jgi:hypothetical protein
MQYGNQVGDAGAELIGEALKINSSLQQLRVVRCGFWSFFFYAFYSELLCSCDL